MLPKNGQTNDNFSHFAKHRLLKQTSCCNPPLDQKLVCFNLSFKNQNTDVEQKTQHKIGKKKDKTKGVERENKTEKQKKTERINEKHFQF